MATPTPVIKIKKLVEDAVMPEIKTDGAVGFDLTAVDNYNILPTTVMSRAAMVRTGIAMELPKGYYATLHMRSSTGRDTKMRLANQTGIIDTDYRGEIVLLVENIGKYAQSISKGQRIAQMIIHKTVPVKFELTEELTVTNRNAQGFGSTGK